MSYCPWVIITDLRVKGLLMPWPRSIALSLLSFPLRLRAIYFHLENSISYNEMFEKLNIAIRQFAKRQMTWYRRMERNGVNIHWIDGTHSDKKKLDEVCRLYADFVEFH